MPDTVRGHSGEESAIKNAIRECIDHGILADYLKRKGSEVENMLIAEYSYEEDIQVKQQEAEQQGRTKGRQEGLILSGRIFQTVKRHFGWIGFLLSQYHMNTAIIQDGRCCLAVWNCLP